jgi:hypothetical protein
MTHEDLRAAAEAAHEEVNRRREACEAAATALDAADADYDRDASDWHWQRLEQARGGHARAERTLQRAERISAEAHDAVAAAAKVDLERAFRAKVEEASERRFLDNLRPTISRVVALDAHRAELWREASRVLSLQQAATASARQLAEVLGIDAQDVSVRDLDEVDLHDVVGVAVELDRKANERSAAGDEISVFEKPGWNSELLPRWQWAQSLLTTTTQEEETDHGSDDDERREGGVGSAEGDAGREGPDDPLEESDSEPMADDASRRGQQTHDVCDSAE